MAIRPGIPHRRAGRGDRRPRPVVACSRPARAASPRGNHLHRTQPAVRRSAPDSRPMMSVLTSPPNHRHPRRDRQPIDTPRVCRCCPSLPGGTDDIYNIPPGSPWSVARPRATSTRAGRSAAGRVTVRVASSPPSWMSIMRRVASNDARSRRVAEVEPQLRQVIQERDVPRASAGGCGLVSWSLVLPHPPLPADRRAASEASSAPDRR
jgi:hypothetical protein